MSRSLVTAAVATAISASPEAGVTKGSLQIQLEVQNSCTVTAPAHSPHRAPIRVDCTKDTPYVVETKLPVTKGDPVTVTVRY